MIRAVGGSFYTLGSRCIVWVYPFYHANIARNGTKLALGASKEIEKGIFFPFDTLVRIIVILTSAFAVFNCTLD